MQRDSDTLIMVSQAHLYFVKRNISESIAMLVHKFEKSIISAGVTNVPKCQIILMQASLHAV